MKTINLNQTLIPLSPPIIMGILNVTEDSFFDGGKYVSDIEIVKHVEKMLAEGAAIIDLGTVSTAPDSVEISEKQEFDSVKKYLKLIRSNFPHAHISVDTFRANVADMAIHEGASMINDISGGADPEMFETIGKYKIPYILTHNSRNHPLAMNELLPKMLSFFGNNIEKLICNGVKDIIIDPGFGFGKTVEESYYLLRNLTLFSLINFPMIVGISRKSLIQKTLNVTSAESLNGTTSLNTIALLQGASILRVHDVKACAEVIKIHSYYSHY